MVACCIGASFPARIISELNKKGRRMQWKSIKRNWRVTFAVKYSKINTVYIIVAALTVMDPPKSTVLFVPNAVSWFVLPTRCDWIWPYIWFQACHLEIKLIWITMRNLIVDAHQFISAMNVERPWQLSTRWRNTWWFTPEREISHAVSVIWD